MPTKGNPGQSEAEPGEEVIHLTLGHICVESYNIENV
jgi:hypothetical protein